MKLTPQEFLQAIKEGKKEFNLNRTESMHIDASEFKKLTSKRYGHTAESATEHLTTDYTNGYTICGKCGSFFQLGKGFTKHLSNGCLHCEGEEKHKVYFVNASPSQCGGFPARYMCAMFDDGIQYTKDRLQVEKYKDLI